MRTSFRSLAVIAAALATTGCVAGSDHRAPTIAMASDFRFEPIRSRDPDAQWWKAYRNGAIDDFVNRGMAQNLRVQQALQRVIEARARLDATASSAIGGDVRSTAELANGAAVRDRFARQTVLQAGLSASAAWQVDLFGQLRRAREASAASLDIAQVDVKAAQLQFIAEVVDAVIDALSFREGGKVALQNLSSQQRLVSTLRQRLDRGEATSLALARAQALMNSTAAQVPAFDAGYQSALSRLSVLLDEPVPAFEGRIRNAPALELPQGQRGVGTPADLLRRRPDIRRAERALAVATAEAGVAEALLYPSITLRGSVSLTDLALGVATGGRFGASLGPQITIPTLDLPRLAANAAAARSVIESRHLEWRQTVLTSVAETETALARLRAGRQSVGKLQDAVRANEKASNLVASALALGAVTTSEVIDVERSLAQSREQLVNGRQQLAKSFAQLHIALGAGSDVMVRPPEQRHLHIPPSGTAAANGGSVEPVTGNPILAEAATQAALADPRFSLQTSAQSANPDTVGSIARQPGLPAPVRPPLVMSGPPVAATAGPAETTLASAPQPAPASRRRTAFRIGSLFQMTSVPAITERPADAP